MTRAPLGRYLLQSSRGPGWAARAGWSARRRPVPARRCRGGRRARTGTPAGNAGRHESSKVRAVVPTTRRSPLIRWPPQLAASQISAAARITTKNTTTMTAAGIARSLRSCLCTSVPLAVDGARARRRKQAWNRYAGGFGCPGPRLQLPNLRLFDPALRTEPSGERSPRRPRRSGLSNRAARLVVVGVASAPLTCWWWVPAAVACHPGPSPAR